MSTPRNLSKLAENTDSSGVLGIASGGTGSSDAASAKASLGLHAVATSGSYTDLTNKPTTAQISENTNLYYTDARVRAAVSASGSLAYNSSTGVFSYTTPTTTGITEGTNLYYTDTRARGAFSSGTGISYNSSSGVITSTITQYTDTLARGAVSASGSLAYNSSTGVFSYTTPSTTGITEGSNLYYTDARARAAISVTGSGSYNSTTGVITVTGGVTSVNTRTGAVTLTSSDVGLGSVENKSSSTIRGELTSSNVTTALGYTPENSANRGVANGYASLNSSGQIPSSQLPSYVDDVLEAANLASFPVSGETGKIYVALDTNKTYRWSGSAYVYITSGAVDSVAGKTGVVSLVAADVGLGNVENKSSATIRGEITNTNVTTALGYTPYNSTNPSGYITGITSSNVTTALGFTPYNSTNPSGYITSSALSGYLTSSTASSTYAPLTGTGASGTWGISITGSAAQLNGKASQDGVGANTIPTRDVNGYTFLNYINSNTGNSENPGVSQVIVTNGGDNYYRKASIAHFTSTVQSNASGTWGINVTGNAATSTTATNQSGGTVSATTGYFGGQVTVDGFGNDAGISFRSGFTPVNTGIRAKATATANRDGVELLGYNGIDFSTQNGGYLAGRITYAGNTTFYTDVRAPIFYDSNDTGYYVDPASTSKLLGLTVGDNTNTAGYLKVSRGNYNQVNITHGSNSSWGLLIGHGDGSLTGGYHGSNVAAIINVPNAKLVLGTNNTAQAEITTGGSIYGYSDVRAPIFYDSDNTGYYVNPASTSVLNVLNLPSGSQSINTTTPGTATYQLNFTGQSTGDYAQAITWGWASSGAQAGIYVQSSGAYGTKMYIATTDSFATGSKTALSIDHVGNVNLARGTFSNGSVWINNGVNTSSWNENIRLFDSPDGVSTIAFGASGTSGQPRNSFVSYPSYLAVFAGGTVVESIYNNYLTASGSYRAPIFYDSNDTSYNADLNSQSYMRYLRIAGDWGGSVDTAAFGIRGTYPSITLRSTTSNSVWLRHMDGAGDIQHYYAPGTVDGNSWSVKHYMTTGGTFGSIGDHRAPIFYDSNDTGTYINPNGASIINAGGSYPMEFKSSQRYIARFWNQSVAGAGWWLANDSNTLVFHADSVGDRASLDSSANFTANGSSRAPLFYDSNDTGYYTDPASTSVLNAVNYYGVQYWTGNGAYARGTPTYGYRFNNNADTINAFVIDNSGNTTSYSSSRAPIFYDSNDTGFYVDPTSTTRLNSLVVGYAQGASTIDMYDSNESTRFIHNNSSTIGFLNASGSWRFRMGDDGNVVMGTYQDWLSNQIRSNIFYDHNNTGYYLNPDSTSQFNAVYLEGYGNNRAIGKTHSGSDFGSGTLVQTNIWAADWAGASFVLECTGKSYSGLPPFNFMVQGYLYADTIINCSAINHGTPISYVKVFNYNNYLCFWWPRWGYWNSFEVRVRDAGGDSANRVTSIGDSGLPSGSKMVTANLFNTALYGYNQGGELYSNIYYDTNDTTYYLDPASSTSLRTYGSWRATSSPWDGEFSGKIQYHGSCWYFQAADQWIWRNAGGSNVIYGDQSGNHWATSSSRAPLFYDNNDTSYYVDPHSTSYQRSLFLGAHDSGEAEFRFGEDSSGWYGERWYWDSAYTVYKYSRYAGSNSIISYHDTRYPDKEYQARNLIFDNYGIGIVGTYSSYRYQGVFSMGDSYKLPADGTTTGNLYGLAWAHPNVGGAAGNLNTHGLLALENGSWLASLTGSTRARDDMRAPIFYDNNDTGYYVNPNGTTQLAYVLANDWFRPQGGTGVYWQDYGRGIRASDSEYSYGNIGTYGSGLNGWRGFGIYPNNAILMFSGSSGGLYNPQWGWMMNMDMIGNVTFGNNVTAYSDLRLKQNVRDIDNVVERRNTLALAAIKYERDGRTRIGYGAQTLRDSGCAEFVHEADDALKVVTGLGTLSVDYGETAAILAVASKMTDDRVAQLEDKVAQLEALVEKLIGNQNASRNS